MKQMSWICATSENIFANVFILTVRSAVGKLENSQKEKIYTH